MNTATSITVRVPLAIRFRPGRKTVVTPMADGVAPVTTRADPALVKALARAFRYQRMLDQGRYASITEMEAAERLERATSAASSASPSWRRTSCRPSWAGGSRRA
ncbi:hypothetical protein [Falsiroseomonas sp. E2-1-a20]|uniref:hypothetical protein n=1 Tax=Falsiroseomonas sp. E2-1-a20 TaxID=3239300 RepID=UPI003F37C873